MKKLAASFSALICLSIFLPLTTFAQGTQYDTFNTPNISPDGVIEGKGFIPCSGTTCSPCDLIVLFNTVLKWFLTISFLIFAIVALVAGIKLVTQGNPGALADAKKSFTNAFIGLIIILSAFLIVDTLMRYLVRDGGDIEGYGPWQKVACATQSEAKTEKGLFGGDDAYVPGTIMQKSQAVPYTGGDLGQCSPSNQYCSVQALINAGMTPQQANIMSCMALTESSGDPSKKPFEGHPESSACGLFQIIRPTWDLNSSGSCKSFSTCTNATCNIKTTITMINRNGYRDYTCAGCNNKAERCIQQYGG